MSSATELKFLFTTVISIVVIFNSLSVSAVLLVPKKSADPLPVVSTPSGSLRGSILQTWTNKNFYAFRGIPFAEPPLGNLRFKAPVPKKPWEGIIDATKDGKVCFQNAATTSSFFGQEDEDCLFLNVYTKKVDGNHPVIVYFYSDGFHVGSSASDILGPQYLLDHDIVLVTVNYRLDAIGFLSTGDKAATGNYGLKDQVEALRWVKKHITSFGGNPNQVTLAGYGAGATSTFFHMFSPMSKGLFHRVIAMSGAATGDHLIGKHSVANTKKLAKLLNCPTDDTTKLVECLKRLPGKEINSKFNEQRVIAGLPMIRFGPIIETDLGTGEERFLTGDPATLLKSKQFYQVPVVTGVTEFELDYWFQDTFHNDAKRKELIDNFDTIAPQIFEYDDRNSTEVQKITNEMKKFYFGDKPIDKYSAIDLGKWFSDFAVIFGGYTTMKYLTFFSEQPVYFYLFTHKGLYSHVKNITTGDVVGPTHHDDLLYLFYISKLFPEIKPDSPEGNIVKTETSIWKNFATTSNPTPDNSPVQWPPLQKTSFKYLNINQHLKLQDTSESPFGNRVYHYEVTMH